MWDHAQLVHAQWLHAAREKVTLFIKRVGSKDNIADLPSRKVLVSSYAQVLVCLLVAAGFRAYAGIAGRTRQGSSYEGVREQRDMGCLAGKMRYVIPLFAMFVSWFRS